VEGVKTWTGQLPSSIVKCTLRQWNASPLSTTPSHVFSRRVKGDISYFAEIGHFSFTLTVAPTRTLIYRRAEIASHQLQRRSFSL
jgi:hypothetical protein